MGDRIIHIVRFHGFAIRQADRPFCMMVYFKMLKRIVQELRWNIGILLTSSRAPKGTKNNFTENDI